MALRNQPYIPLFVEDYLTDEKLNECSASSQGIYIKIMCLMHKSDEYGVILLEQKYKQNSSRVKAFASKLIKHTCFNEAEICSAIKELTENKVLFIEDGKLIQRRMVKDNRVSLERAKAGSKGGKISHFVQAKPQANTEYENESTKEKSIYKKI